MWISLVRGKLPAFCESYILWWFQGDKRNLKSIFVVLLFGSCFDPQSVLLQSSRARLVEFGHAANENTIVGKT